MRFILKLIFFCSTLLSAQTNTVNVTSQSISVSGEEVHELMFGFCEGDLVTFNLNERKNKKIKKVEIIDYPSGNIFYSEYKNSSANYSFKALQTGIILFRITNKVGKRICEVEISRTPKDESTLNFN